MRKTAEQLIKTGKAEHPIIGVILDRAVHGGDGVKILEASTANRQPVTPEGPAGKAGVQPGDVIVEFDGRRVTDPDDLVVAIRAKSVGDEVTMKVRRDCVRSVSGWSCRERPTSDQDRVIKTRTGRVNINGWEFILLIVLAVVILGPERLPEYAAKLGRFVRQARIMAESAKGQLREQMGPEFDDIDWRQYDPRQYDPRRIVREALLDDSPFEPDAARRAAPTSSERVRPGQADALRPRRHLTTTHEREGMPVSGRRGQPE